MATICRQNFHDCEKLYNPIENFIVVDNIRMKLIKIQAQKNLFDDFRRWSLNRKIETLVLGKILYCIGGMRIIETIELAETKATELRFRLFHRNMERKQT